MLLESGVPDEPPELDDEEDAAGAEYELPDEEEDDEPEEYDELEDEEYEELLA